MKNSPMILVDLVVGGVIMGLPLAIIAYYLSFYLVTGARKRMAKRKERRITKQAALLKRQQRATTKETKDNNPNRSDG